VSFFHPSQYNSFSAFLQIIFSFDKLCFFYPKKNDGILDRLPKIKTPFFTPSCEEGKLASICDQGGIHEVPGAQTFVNRFAFIHSSFVHRFLFAG
jgi:hypothetical protein